MINTFQMLLGFSVFSLRFVDDLFWPRSVWVWKVSLWRRVPGNDVWRMSCNYCGLIIIRWLLNFVDLASWMTKQINMLNEVQYLIKKNHYFKMLYTWNLRLDTLNRRKLLRTKKDKTTFFDFFNTCSLKFETMVHTVYIFLTQ